MTESQKTAWPLRPWLLALLLASAGLTAYFILNANWSFASRELKAAVMVFVIVFTLNLSYTLEPTRWRWCVGFAGIAGMLLALVSYMSYGANWQHFEGYSLCSAFFANYIALAFFQTIRQHGRLQTPYPDLHRYAWSNAVSWIIAWLFVGICALLLRLLGALFELVGIDTLTRLLSFDWFWYPFVGLTFGAALGIQKEQWWVVASSQNLVLTIFAILSPLVCLSLILFLLILPVTGLETLWSATRVTTPILISCSVVALALVNAVLRDHTEQEARQKLLRYSAVGLAFCTLPISVIALISLMQRSEQYGLTPERLWGYVAIGIALCYGLFYLGSLLAFARENASSWTQSIRQSNIYLAIVVTVIMLFLSFQVINFNQLSTDSQLQRLVDKKVTVEDFDYASLAFRFGEEGRDALRELNRDGGTVVNHRAKMALSEQNHWTLRKQLADLKSGELTQSKLIIHPQSIALPQSLQSVIEKQTACLSDFCLLIWDGISRSARLISANCPSYRPNDRVPENGYRSCPPSVFSLEEKEGKWQENTGSDARYTKRTKQGIDDDRKYILRAINNGEIDIRITEKRQLYIGGKPVGEPY